MGQSQSKVNPTISHPLASAVESSTAEEISTPAPPRHITRLSELIDLRDLFEADGPTPDSPDSPTSPTSPTSSSSPTSTNFPNSPESPSSISPLTTRRSKPVLVQSPSGNVLSPQEFLRRPDRKLTLEERKQSIRMNTEIQIQQQQSSGGKGGKDQQKKARRQCLGFWGA